MVELFSGSLRIGDSVALQTYPLFYNVGLVLQLGFRLQQFAGAAGIKALASAPRSRKNGETWGTRV
jgi:hypothetical protein